MVKKDRIMNVDEVSEMLHFKKGYIYQLVHARKIPFHKPTGRMLLFAESEILDWFNDCKYNTEDE